MNDSDLLADKFVYRYSNLEYMRHDEQYKIFKNITSNSTNLFLKGGDIISTKPSVSGRHEVDTEELIKFYKNNGYKDFFIDIGANIGLTTCFAGHGFNKNFCYEPNPQLFRILQTNIEIAFGIKHNINLYNFALGVNDGILTLTVPRGNYGGAYISHKNTYDDDLLLQKDSITDKSNAYEYIDVLVKNASVHFVDIFKNSICQNERGIIKIDVEGYEPHIIKAIANSLMDTQSCVIVFENWDKNLDINNLLGYFSHNVSLYKLQHNPVRRFKLLRKIKSMLGAKGSYTLSPVKNGDCRGQLLVAVNSWKNK